MTDAPRLRIHDLPGARAALQQEKLLRAISTHPEMTSTTRRIQALIAEPATAPLLKSIAQALEPTKPDLTHLTRAVLRTPAAAATTAACNTLAGTILADLSANISTHIFQDLADALARHGYADAPPATEPEPADEPEEPIDYLDVSVLDFPRERYEPADDLDVPDFPHLGSPKEPDEPSFTREQLRLIVVWYVHALAFLVTLHLMLTYGNVSGVANTAFGVSAWGVAKMCADQVGKAFDRLYPPDGDEED
ncbi:hypothetical protein [Streptosporangium sandarakinum]|uniref:hypothetical protein n=1 Tax=Streptosporangium sandarakinum TaxID=1260955 RepID=UPI00379FD11C